MQNHWLLLLGAAGFVASVHCCCRAASLKVLHTSGFGTQMIFLTCVKQDHFTYIFSRVIAIDVKAGWWSYGFCCLSQCHKKREASASRDLNQLSRKRGRPELRFYSHRDYTERPPFLRKHLHEKHLPKTHLAEDKLSKDICFQKSTSCSRESSQLASLAIF